MPHRRGIGCQPDGEQSLDHAKQPRQHLGFGKVLLHLVIRKTVALLFELLRGPGQIPAFQRVHAKFLPGKIPQFGDVPLGERARLGRHVALESGDLGRGIRHFGSERDLGEVGIAQHLRFFVAQGQQAVDQRSVVQFLAAEFGGAGGGSSVHARTQLAVVAVLQHRDVGGRVQGEFPALFAVLLRGCLRGCLRIIRQPGQVGFTLYPLGMGVGRVQQVFGELCAQRRQFFLDFLEARLAFFRQFRSRQSKVAQFIFYDASSRGR